MPVSSANSRCSASRARYGRRMTIVHVVNGDSVEHTLAHADLPGRVVVWRDVLYEGDVPPGDPPAVLRARAAFLAGADHGSRERIYADLAAADAALVAALDDGCETVLWFEHDLHDQLQLIQILARIAGHPRRDAARLIALDSFPGRPGFRGLGELSAEELVTLWPTRAAIPAERLRHGDTRLRGAAGIRRRHARGAWRRALRGAAVPRRRAAPAAGGAAMGRPRSRPQRAPDPARRRRRRARSGRGLPGDDAHGGGALQRRLLDLQAHRRPRSRYAAAARGDGERSRPDARRPGGARVLAPTARTRTSRTAPASDPRLS